MRWMFLLLLVLNAFYYLWHQQEAPLRVKEITPLSLSRTKNQDIQLLSESGSSGLTDSALKEGGKCLCLGGDLPLSQIEKVGQRLTSLDIQIQPIESVGRVHDGYWVKVSPDSRRLVDDALLSGLRKDFPQLKSKIISCKGIASAG